MQVERVLLNATAITKHALAIRIITEKLIAAHSIEHVGAKTKYLNVVRDVINVLPVVWIADEIVKRLVSRRLSALTGGSDWAAVEDGRKSEWHIPPSRGG